MIKIETNFGKYPLEKKEKKKKFSRINFASGL